MPAQDNDDDIHEEQGGPGERHMSWPVIWIVGIYLVVMSVLVLYSLVKLWPYPTPSGEPKETPTTSQTAPVSTATPALVSGGSATPGESPGSAVVTVTPTPTPAPPTTPSPAPARASGEKTLPDPEFVSMFRGWLQGELYLETRLLLLVMLSGALGSLMHSLRSLYWYAGNRMLVWSWLGLYLLLPFTGAILAVIFYFVVRGGFFSPQASFENTSPFGFAALSALVGLFSPQATLKLKEVAETIFTKPGKGEDSKPEKTEEDESKTPTLGDNPIEPNSGPVDGGTKVTIKGQGFVSGVAVKFGSQSAVVNSSSNTSIDVTTPSTTGPGAVDVEVTNPDGEKVTLPQGFTYVEAPPGGGG
ncbi:MAG TPA: IPT/TIG domain-containing protein [Pyrinomonadaceae bacterium]|nr:IPT/TIG domain-containing protein [Pyrinomonadaceae bacterium]